MIEKTFLNPTTNKQWRIEIDGHTIRTCLNGGKVKEILCDSAFQVRSKAASAMMSQMRKGFVYQNRDAAVGQARCHRFVGKDSNGFMPLAASLSAGGEPSRDVTLTDGSYVLGVTIVVQMWISLGAGFLALRAGFQNIDRSQYEAGAIEGIKSRWQELIYITIPSMGPQLMFAAVMQIVSSFTAGTVSQNLVGFPSTDYKAHTIMNHAYDYGWIRYEMGYASAICMILFVVMYILNKLIGKVLSKYMD